MLLASSQTNYSRRWMKTVGLQWKVVRSCITLLTFAVTANFLKNFLYSSRFGSQPRKRTDRSLKTWRITSTSKLSRVPQKSSKYFLLLDWKTKNNNLPLTLKKGANLEREYRANDAVKTYQGTHVKSTITKALDYQVSTKIWPGLI